jgi:PEP-CTERM motif
VQYDTNMFSFNEQRSGFLCQFSQDGDCPPVGAAAGTFPLGVLPSSGFNPGNELPGSSVTLTDAMGEVSLNYLLASPITTPTETNFFLYFFDFKNPLLIDVSRSTATYFSSGSGSHFNQTDFACITTDRQGCGSDNGISGITLNLSAPEPSTSLLFGIGLLSLLGYGWRRQKRSGSRLCWCGHLTNFYPKL